MQSIQENEDASINFFIQKKKLSKNSFYKIYEKVSRLFISKLRKKISYELNVVHGW